MRRILVTGGNKGIGLAICEKLLKDYADTVVILGSRNEERGRAAIEMIQKTIGYDTCQDRLSLLIIDTSNTESITTAVKEFRSNNINNSELYGIINNAAIGWGHTPEETIRTNYLGPRQVNELFSPYMRRPGGRIVNIASGAGPMYLQELSDKDEIKIKLSKPWLLTNGVLDVDEIAHQMSNDESSKNKTNPYGPSKALLNAYTILYAKLEPQLIINSCTPGFIATDMAKKYGATNPPSIGAIPPCWLMMDDTTIPMLPSGRYYGSDCIRSPIDCYRGPGEPPYENNDDIL